VDDSRDYLEALNPEQLAAVRHEGDSLLILAGAGSGKTRVITTKIAWLVRERGVSPESILAVTFTNKAAREMRDRATAIESSCSRAVMRTFHSFGAWFLRRNAVSAGLDPNFTIYDDDDQVTLLRGILPEQARKDCSRIAQSISRAKDYGLEPDSPDLSSASSDPKFRRVFAQYEEKLKATGNVDFGDLIRLPARLLRDDPIVRRRTRQRFRVVLVDEYQDSNVAQFELLRLLAGPDPEYGKAPYLCVVGDDDQSIYRFRGAEVKNILNFPAIFPGTDIVKLETNYRSYQSILDLAAETVAHNAGRLGKELRAARRGGEKPRLALLEDQDDETRYCARVCEERVKKGGRWSDLAILYRTNAQSLSFEKEFPRRGIPYRIVGALRFYEREEIKDVLAWLAFVSNPRDEVAFKRIVNKPSRGIGETSLDAIVEAASFSGGDLLAAADAAGSELKGRAKKGIKEFAELARSLGKLVARTAPAVEAPDANADPLEEAPPATLAERQTERRNKKAAGPAGTLAELVERIARDSGLLDYHRDQDEIAGTQKVANLDELVNAASLYGLDSRGLAEFLETIELDRSLASEESQADAVTLITMHNTKGLEFPVVLATGLEQGLFPRDDDEGEELEEQRRLFYVATTRAKDELHLTAARRRMMRGQIFETLPSLFLTEMNPTLFEVAPGISIGGRGGARGADSSAAQLPGSGVANGKATRVYARSPEGAGAKAAAAAWRAGQAVYHDDYGSGVIIKVEPTPSSGPLVVVRFETGREARFFPSFTTKLERLQ